MADQVEEAGSAGFDAEHSAEKFAEFLVAGDEEHLIAVEAEEDVDGHLAGAVIEVAVKAVSDGGDKIVEGVGISVDRRIGDGGGHVGSFVGGDVGGTEYGEAVEFSAVAGVIVEGSSAVGFDVGGAAEGGQGVGGNEAGVGTTGSPKSR